MSTLSTTDIMEKFIHNSRKISLRDLYIFELGFNEYTLQELYLILKDINEKRMNDRFYITQNSLGNFTRKLAEHGIIEYVHAKEKYLLRLTHNGYLEYKKIREQINNSI